jgi:hypothetical protein
MREMPGNETDETRQFGVQEEDLEGRYVSSRKVSAIDSLVTRQDRYGVKQACES